MEITEQLIKKSCSSTIYARGTEYFSEGRVHLRKREDKLITAVVDGDELYNVQVKFGENEITDYFCTCPYYETMNSMCKHIVATLKQRQAELEEGGSFVDENDKLAQLLCNKFAAKSAQKESLRVGFVMYIDRLRGGSANYGMSIETDGLGNSIHGVENFLESYLKDKPFKIDRKQSYTPNVTVFSEAQTEIIDILAENYENRSSQSVFYTKAAYRTSFGARSAKRIFPLLSEVDFSLVFDGMTLGRVPIREENPDIIVDVAASDSDISLTVADRGFALTDDGEWFLYENVICHTDSEWREYYMPIYNTLVAQNRTQISFKGENTMLFATCVLPYIKDKHGIVTRGIEDMVVNETPLFEVYFDVYRNGITAVVIARYGDVSIRLPGESQADAQKKIVVRSFDKENDVLSCFSDFSMSDNSYFLYSDIGIYNFITNTLPELENKAETHYSDRFKSLRIPEKVSMSASVRYNSDIDLLEADFDTDLSYEQICGILTAVKTKKSFYRLSNGRFLDLENGEGRTVFELLNRLNFTNEDIKGKSKRLETRHALYLDAVGSIDKTDSFKEYIEKIRSIEPKIPDCLTDVLRPYQKTGVKWLKQLSEFGFGGILADDMGLGKTLQVIAYVHGERPQKPALIVAPSALTYNWLNEIKRFTPDASAVIIDGAKDERAELIKNLDDYEFVITSYPMLRRDIALYKDVEFEYCFIDEAQHIKNAKTMNARSVKRINARRCFALTGTPVENSLMELWSIFDFAMSGYLYDAREFRGRYEYPMIKENDEEAGADLKMRIKPFILRRMKSEVLNELPEKIENTIYADLTREQKDLYSAYLASARSETAALLSEGGRGKMQILTLLMRLRQICCHPMLFDENYNNDSGKLELLMEITQSAIASGHRLLVFSQFTSMLEIIKRELDRMKIPSFYLDGKTPSYERLELADRFNGGERDVFLISLKAGGTGLNLVGADMVIHYDPWWNPAVTDQASDRAYRIGQTRAVQVIRLAARGTIEEKILKLQEAKRSLANDIVRVNNDAFGNLSNEEILSLFE